MWWLQAVVTGLLYVHVHGGILGLGGKADNYALECARQRCNGTCYISHPTDCFKFIVCQQTAIGGFYAQEMPCAFGTMWKTKGEPACDIPTLAKCKHDLCKDPAIVNYKHHDRNCRTFWRCEKGRSVASCCNLYQRFVNGTCVDDITCDVSCPLLNDATCRGHGVKALNFRDGNCKTHFVCVNSRPHPVCCKDGERYDIMNGVCVPDPTCKQPCPREYQGLCSKLNVTSYPLMDRNCRTHMRCNSLGLDEPHCCRTGHMYDPQTKQCVSGIFPYECEYANCPLGYIEECPYEAVLTNPYVFKNLDSHGGQLMNCPVGTLFDQKKCRCSVDHDFFKRAKARGRGCDIAVHLVFPNLKNLGVAGAAILMIGDYGQGEKGVGNMKKQWAGSSGVNIPYYGGQELRSFYLEIAFTPTGTTMLPQILLSSCFYRTYFDTVERPSLEVAILPPGPNNTHVLKVNIGDKLGTTYLEDPLSYELNVMYNLRVVYDGKLVGILLDRADGAMAPVRDIMELTGVVPIYRAGLRFAHCRYEQDVSSFIGTVDEIKFSKCVNDTMKSMLYPTAVVQPGV